MIHIILFALKVIGWIFLAFLGLLLLIIAVLLFVPVRYRIEADKHEEVKGRAKAFWLFHAFSVTAVYEKKLDLSIRILGFPLKGKREEGQLTEEEIQDNAFHDMAAEEASDGIGEDKPAPDVHIASLEDSSEDFVYGEQPQREIEEKKDRRKKRQKEKKIQKKIPSKGLFSRIKEMIRLFIKKIKNQIRKLLEKWKEVKDKAASLKEFVSDRENQQAFKLLLKQTKALLRHILPRKIRGRLYVGFEDPYTTGQVIAAAGLLCPVYKNSLQIYPSFEEAVLEGQITCRGRIRLYSLAIIAGRLFMNKRLRYLFKKLMR
ncbi:DUF2953 domain-containing protein [Lachnospiraceae bacterium 62-35]